MGGGQTSISLVPVGNPGNANDTTGYGSVGYNYSIDKYDVTLGQYTQFLNAVAKTDTYGLYNSYMSTDYNTQGIQQTGSPGSYSYSVTGSNPQAANCPVFDVTWFDAARFSNWLQNGQGTAATVGQALRDRNRGVHAQRRHDKRYGKPKCQCEVFHPLGKRMVQGGVLQSLVGNLQHLRNAEQYRAVELAVLVPNDANYYNGGYTDSTNYVTPVGYFSTSPSYYGTFDQSGDVWNWNDAIISGSYRGLRGGYWSDADSSSLASSVRNYADPTFENHGIGFRVAGSVAVPEPTSIALLLAGAVALGIWRLRRKA